MLFSQGDKDNQQPKKTSIWGLLFNPKFGDDIRPIGQNLRMFARFMMFILASQKLFPKEHPAYADENYPITLLDVFKIAYSRLSFTKEGIPQIMLFAAVVGCYVFSILFVITFLLSLLVGNAHAAEESLFTLNNAGASCDLAQRWLDYLFMGGDVNSGSGCGTGVMAPNGQAIQEALGTGLAMYSRAVLVCAGFILLYHLASMIAETAHTGKPMGRANQIWAPIRLVVAIGLLVPIGAGTSGMSAGLNTGQFIVVQFARWGSSMASNVWVGFLDALSSEMNGDKLVVPAPPRSEDVVKQIIMIEACRAVFNDNMEKFFNEAGLSDKMEEYRIERKGPRDINCMPDAGEYAGHDVSIDVSFNTPKCGEYYVYEKNSEPGLLSSNVSCGMITLRDTEPKGSSASTYKASSDIQQSVRAAVKGLITGSEARTIAQEALYLNDASFNEFGEPTNTKGKEIVNKVNKLTTDFSRDLSTKITSAVNGSGNADWSKRLSYIRSEWGSQGWVMAGAWFNTVARAQGAVFDQVHAAMNVEMDPPKLEFGAATSIFTNITSVFGWNKTATGLKSAEAAVTDALTRFENLVMRASTAKAVESATMGTDSSENMSPGALAAAMFWAIDGLASMAGLWKDGNLAMAFGANANPLAEIVAQGYRFIHVGFSIITYCGIGVAVMGVAGAWAGLKAGAAMGTVVGPAGTVTGAVSGAAVGFTLGAALAKLAGGLFGVAITIGASFVVLGMMFAFYLPLIPFIKFFFNIMTWVLMVFEAVVSAPLFALAHLTPYGDGLPGGMAQKGYFFLLNLLLRPVLLVIGLVSGLLIFFIAIYFLNNTFAIATAGVGAVEGSLATMAKIVYSLIYGAFVYICASTCFKSITFFADHGLSWMSASGQAAPQLGDKGEMGKAMGAAGLYMGHKMGEQISQAAQQPGASYEKARAQKKQAVDDKKAEIAADNSTKLQQQIAADTKATRDNTRIMTDDLAGVLQNTGRTADATEDTANSSAETAKHMPRIADNTEQTADNTGRTADSADDINKKI